jgi:hypothetical protein
VITLFKHYTDIYFKQALIISLFCFLYTSTSGQNKIDSVKTLDTTKPALILIKGDTLHKKNRRSPKKAALFSAIVPGLGQAYNRSYWKIPIVYAVMGGLAYLTLDNHKEYEKYRQELIFRRANKDQINNFINLREADLISGKEVFRRYRDISGLFLILSYASNIIEANVDAHLSTYDISDDLSLKWQPHYQLGQNPNAGITLTFQFKK